jgi:predicted RNase H-like HicB family nuclease
MAQKVRTQAKKSYTVDYKRGTDGLWVAAVRGLSGCHTQGRTIEEARRRIREALSLYIPDDAAREAELLDKVELPTELQEKIAAARRAAEQATRLAADARLLAKAVIDDVTQKRHMSLRDAGELLGMTRQWAHEIARGRPLRKPRVRASAAKRTLPKARAKSA